MSKLNEVKPSLSDLFDDLYHPNPNINRKAYFKMFKYWPEESLSRLLRNLSHHDITIRRISVKALGIFGEMVFNPIEELLKSCSDTVIQVSCLKTLVQVIINNESVIFPSGIMEAIALALESENPELTLTIIPLLRQLGKQGLPLLIKASTDQDILKASAAVTALSEINDPLAR